VSITINELTIHVPGNVVKTNDGGVTRLRMTQEQLQHIIDQGIPVLDFFKSQDAPAFDGAHPHISPVVVEDPPTGSQEALKNQIDGPASAVGGKPVSDKRLAENLDPKEATG
jgi:hypothetical protein